MLKMGNDRPKVKIHNSSREKYTVKISQFESGNI